MDAATQEDLVKIKDAVLKELKDVEAIYLFGSVARGTQNEKSDYDIAIFVKSQPKDKLDVLTNIRMGLNKKVSRPIEHLY
jgi:predicted nucleotidyltransferase